MSAERDETRDQPLPQVNDRAFVQDLVIADIEERKEFGIRKYGTALQSGNGRDMLMDAYEEVLDLAIYLRGMKDEDHHVEIDLSAARRELADLRRRIVELAEGIEAGTRDFMEGYERAGEGVSSRMSGEAVAMIVQVRSEMAQYVRDLLKGVS